MYANSIISIHRRRAGRTSGNRVVITRLVCAVITLTLYSIPAFCETRGFVVSYFHTATHSDQANCPDGVNTEDDILRHGFASQNISGEELTRIVKEGRQYAIAYMRGKKDGKPANISYYPQSAPDPQLKINQGRLAYGFNLDGAGSTAVSFEDPDTHQQGVDNQLYRVMGCSGDYDISLPVRPGWEDQVWTIMAEHMPAWLFTITADNLNKDGPATATFYRAQGYRRTNAEPGGMGTLANMTYVVDQNPRNTGTFRGVIKNGVFTSQGDDGFLSLEGQANMTFFAKMDLSRAQLRLDLNDGNASGYIGGYQPWLDYWFMVAIIESEVVDSVGLYYALQRYADADPDPVTGNNTRISATFRIEAVPAFVARPDGALISQTH